MNTSDQAEFMELLGDLFGAHGQNVKAHIMGGYWKGLAHMTLGEFRRVCEYALEQLQHTERGVARPPTVSEIWDKHRELTRSSSSTKSVDESSKFHGDGWSVQGNLLLLAHIARSSSSIDYAPDAGGHPMHTGPHTEAIAKILAKWKNAWATDMREDREYHGGKLDGKASWIACMSSADAEVRAYLERFVTRAAA